MREQKQEDNRIKSGHIHGGHVREWHDVID